MEVIDAIGELELAGTVVVIADAAADSATVGEVEDSDPVAERELFSASA